MFETTKDIFWLVGAVSLGACAFFLCWLLFYMILLMRDMSRMVSSVKKKIDLFDAVVELVKEKLEKTTSHLSLIAESILKIAGFFMSGGRKKKSK